MQLTGRFRPLAPSLIALALIALPVAVSAQTVSIRTLSKPDAEYAEAFTNLVGIRELSDGRVIVADAHERTLQLIDLRQGSARVLGREGAGPQEYGYPSRLIPLAGDTTLLYDVGNDRYLIILGDGSIPGTMLLESAGGDRVGGSPMGWDGVGGFYFRRDMYDPGPRAMGDTPKATAVVRFDRTTRRMDTVAVLAVPAGRSQGARQLDGGMLQYLDNKPLAPEDIAAVAPDGRVAVVRASPYRVEWIHRDGRRITGPEVRYQPLRVTDDDKRAYLQSLIRPGAIITRRNPNASGESRALPIRESGLPRVRNSTDINDPSLTWPTHMPPFLAGAARVAPDGSLMVLRTRAHDDPIPTYDVFDGAGRLVNRIALPRDTRVLGFGKGTVYLMRIDEDDLQWIQRYRL